MVDNINDNIFQVSVKGLCFDKDNKIMMLLDEKGNWEPTGGRVQKGEDLIEGLKRESFEETGLECKVLDKRPLIVYSTIDQNGRARLMIYYKIDFENFEFKKSDEHIEMKFFSKDEIRNLQMVPQIKMLPDYL